MLDDGLVARGHLAPAVGEGTAESEGAGNGLGFRAHHRDRLCAVGNAKALSLDCLIPLLLDNET